MFKNLINKLINQSDDTSNKFDDEGVLALSAIFIRIAKLDGNFDINELNAIKQLLIKRFNLTELKINNLLEMAKNLENDANDNIQLTRVIKKHVAYEERFGLLKDSWSLVMADGERSYQEDGFMRLFCNLLGLSDKDNALARQSVLDKKATN